MINELRIDGKVLNSYVNDDGYFICTIANVHDHVVDGFNNVSESVFRAFLMDKGKSAHLDIQKGDKVLITGYLRQDHSMTRSGNEHKRTNLYIKDIELVKPKEEFNMVDYTAKALGMNC